MMHVVKSKITIAFFLLLLVFMTGVLGFHFFSGYTWIDAFYMTVITVTTVGYGEVMPLSYSDKIFVSCLIISSIFIGGYAISVISEYILSKNIDHLRQKKVQKKLDSIKGHIIICGYGSNGKQVALQLQAYNRPYVVIEKDEAVLNKITDEHNIYIQGNAIEDEILMNAGIERASTLICATPSDTDNLFIVLSARQLNKDLKIISRANEETSYKKLLLGGADKVIMPDKIGANHMASLVVVPDLVEFLENLAVSGAQESINVEEVPFEKMCPHGKELAINDLDVRNKTGCSIIGYRSPTGEYIVNPEASLILRKNSKLILIGRPSQIENLKKEYGV